MYDIALGSFIHVCVCVCVCVGFGGQSVDNYMYVYADIINHGYVVKIFWDDLVYCDMRK